MSDDAKQADCLHLMFESTRHTLLPCEQLTFGRDADIVLDATNRHLHRRQGCLYYHAGRWMLSNEGCTVTMVISDLDSASFARLTPGARMPLPYVNQSLAFAAGVANYQLTLSQPSAEFVVRKPRDQSMIPDSRSTQFQVTASITEMSFNSEQLQLLRALAEPRLAGPISASDLPGNLEIAKRLGWSRSKFNRKLDHLCLKFERWGLSGVGPGQQAPAADRRLTLVNFIVESGLITSSTDSGEAAEA